MRAALPACKGFNYCELCPIHTADADATQLNCRVESRRRCVLNSQLVGDSLDESEQFAYNEVELRRVCGVNAPVVRRDPVSNFLRQSHIDCRIVNWVTTADGRVHTAATTQLDSTRQDKFSKCSVSKFSSAVVGRRRELVANSIHTADADADATQLNSTVESRRRRRCVLGITYIHR